MASAHRLWSQKIFYGHRAYFIAVHDVVWSAMFHDHYTRSITITHMLWPLNVLYGQTCSMYRPCFGAITHHMLVKRVLWSY